MHGPPKYAGEFRDYRLSFNIHSKTNSKPFSWASSTACTGWLVCVEWWRLTTTVPLYVCTVSVDATRCSRHPLHQSSATRRHCLHSPPHRRSTALQTTKCDDVSDCSLDVHRQRWRHRVPCSAKMAGFLVALIICRFVLLCHYFGFRLTIQSISQ